MPKDKFGHERRTNQCPCCGEKILDPREAIWINEVDYETTPSGYDLIIKHGSYYRQPYHRKCALRLPICCAVCGNEAQLVEHHISWMPEYTIPVCASCHSRIHRGKGLEGYCPSFNGRKIRHDAFEKILSVKWDRKSLETQIEEWLP